MEISLRDRYRGALLGLAAGDAMGAPLEFMSRQQIQIKHGLVREMIGGGWLSLRPGAYTDDTAMMLCLARSLVEKKRFDVTDVAGRYVEWFRTGPPDIGNTTRAALERIAGGEEADTASRQVYASGGERQGAGNGTVMRCAPLALLLREPGGELMQASLDEARITHHDIRAGSGSAALNLMLAKILQGETDRKAVVQFASETLMTNELGLLNIVSEVGGKEYTDLRPTGFVSDTLETATACFCRTPSFGECIVRVINLGGDSDTIGAVAGALAGAYYGADAIPARWLSMLQDKNVIDQAAHQLFKLSEEPGSKIAPKPKKKRQRGKTA